MSEINCYGTEQIYGYVMPHWSLVRLVDAIDGYYINGNMMKEGSLGLTYQNDPSFIFDMEPMLMSAADDESTADHYYEMIEHYESRLVGEVIYSYLLVKACLDDCWDQKGGLAAWLSDRMAKLLIETGGAPVQQYLSPKERPSKGHRTL